MEAPQQALKIFPISQNHKAELREWIDAPLSRRLELLGISKHGRNLAWTDHQEFLRQYGPLIPADVLNEFFMAADRWTVECYIGLQEITDEGLRARLEQEHLKVVLRMIAGELDARNRRA